MTNPTQTRFTIMNYGPGALAVHLTQPGYQNGGLRLEIPPNGQTGLNLLEGSVCTVQEFVVDTLPNTIATPTDNEEEGTK